MEYIWNKVLGGFVLAYTIIMSGLYLFMVSFNLYESKIMMFISLIIIFVLYFIGIVEWNAEFYDNLYRGTKKPVRS
jgi:hypothetical protein